MLATAVISFREILEAALIIGILMASLRDVVGRVKWTGIGILAGLSGAAIVALLAESIADAIEGSGQEVFNAAVLLIAVGMLAWHNAWMAGHGRKMVAEMKAVGRAVVAGDKSLTAVAVIIATAVMREGSELVLFLYGIAASGDSSVGEMAVGSVLGLVVGAAAGWLLYAGLVRIPVRHLFSTTGTLITLLAAGMAAQAANFLVQADLIPSLGGMVWDTSAVIADDSVLGKLLNALIGYVAKPDATQLTFYLGTIILILMLTRLARPGTSRQISALAAE